MNLGCVTAVRAIHAAVLRCQLRAGGLQHGVGIRGQGARGTVAGLQQGVPITSVARIAIQGAHPLLVSVSLPGVIRPAHRQSQCALQGLHVFAPGACMNRLS